MSSALSRTKNFENPLIRKFLRHFFVRPNPKFRGFFWDENSNWNPTFSIFRKFWKIEKVGFQLEFLSQKFPTPKILDSASQKKLSNFFLINGFSKILVLERADDILLKEELTWKDFVDGKKNSGREKQLYLIGTSGNDVINSRELLTDVTVHQTGHVFMLKWGRRKLQLKILNIYHSGCPKRWRLSGTSLLPITLWRSRF